MRVTEYLAALPMGDLKSMAFTLGVRPGMISRARLVREVTDRIFEPGFIDQCLDDLTEKARDILRAVLLTGASGWIYDTRKPANTALTEPLHGLLTRGLVIGRRRAYRTVDFVVPEDLRDRLIRYYAERLTGFVSASAAKPDEDKSRDLTIIRNIFSLVNGLRHNPVRLTERGEPYKKALGELVRRQERTANGLPDATEDPSATLRFVMEYARWRGLTREADGRLRAAAEFESWLELPTARKIEDLMSFWQGRAGPRSSAVAAVPGVLQLCAGFAQVDLEQVMRCVLTCAAPHGWPDSSDDQARNEVLVALHELEWIGLLRQYGGQNGSGAGLAITPAGRHVFGGRDWSDAQAWRSRFIVQPTFEIIAPRGLDLKIRERLERFTDLEKVDITLTYRVTRDTIYRAANADMSGEEVIDFLAEHSEKDLPQNVAYTIQSWGDAYGQVYFMDAFILRTANAEIASHIKAHGELAPYIKGEVSPDALIVDRKTYRELMDLLRKQDYMPKSEIVGSSRAGSRNPPRGIRSGEEDGNGLEAGETDAPGDTSEPGAQSHTAASSEAASSGPKPVLGFGDCLPGYALRKGSGGAGRNAPHIEQAANLQYLSPGQTEELLEMALRQKHWAVIDYYLGNRSRSFLHRIKPVRIERTRGAPFVEAHRKPEGDVHAFKIANIRAIRIVYDREDQV